MAELKIKSFPFYWRINNKINTHPYIPSKLPYTFKVMENTNLLIEKRNQKLLAHLNKVYNFQNQYLYFQYKPYLKV